MDDDLFGDLFGPKPAPPPLPKSTSMGPSSSARTNDTAKKATETSNHAHDTAKDDLPAPELPHKAESKATGDASPSVIIGKDELRDLINSSIQTALDSTFGKFVRSLRTVLEDMSKRIESNGQAYGDLKDNIEQVRELVDKQTENIHFRFSNLDLSIKEVDRGVQSLRDKQELHEAQALLAKLSDTPDKKALPAPAPGPAAEPTPAPVAPPPAAPPTPIAPVAPVAPALPLQPQQQPQLQPQQPQQQQQHPQHPQQQHPQPQLQQLQQGPPHPNHMAPPPHNAPPGLGGMPSGSLEPQYTPQGPPPPQQQYYQGGPPPPNPIQGGAPPPPGPDPYQQQQQQQQQPPPYGSYSQGGPRPPMPMPMPPAPNMLPPPGPPPHMTQQMPMPAQPMPGPPMPMPGPMYPSLSAYPPPPMIQGQPSYPPPQFRNPSSGGGPAPPPIARTPSGPPAAGPPGSGTSSRAVPLEQIIQDIAAMGFPRAKVLEVVQMLQNSGQSVDLNIILDRLTRGGY